MEDISGQSFIPSNIGRVDDEEMMMMYHKDSTRPFSSVFFNGLPFTPGWGGFFLKPRITLGVSGSRSAKCDYLRPLRREKRHNNWSSRLPGASVSRTVIFVSVLRTTVSRVMTDYINLGKVTSAKHNRGRKSKLKNRDRWMFKRIVTRKRKTAIYIYNVRDKYPPSEPRIHSCPNSYSKTVSFGAGYYEETTVVPKSPKLNTYVMGTSHLV
ncbi:hypothetical protein TNCV_690211 [Trichonephila clavipes]|nr:hypothetical protein TNCV_690211 [Trichonephila clavipes]